MSSHIMDIVANALSAKAKNIDISITNYARTGMLTLTIKDDGVGMDSDMVEKVQDPFFSTKTGRKVGLGIPLLKGTSETTGGTFSLTSKAGQGTEVSASFDFNHPDLPPMGNLKSTIFVLAVGNPDTDFTFTYRRDEKDFVFDTKAVKGLLDGIPINYPDVINFLTKYLDENM